MDARLSTQLLDFNDGGARDGSWGGHLLAILHLAAKLSHVGLMWTG
jgi:hypothetical protein